jgi:hypothetical protein
MMVADGIVAQAAELVTVRSLAPRWQEVSRKIARSGQNRPFFTNCHFMPKGQLRCPSDVARKDSMGSFILSPKPGTRGFPFLV